MKKVAKGVNNPRLTKHSPRMKSPYRHTVTLMAEIPELLKELNRKRNVGLDISRISAGSGRKIWWICKKGHEWEAIIRDRVRDRTRCPYCLQVRPSPDYNLSVLFPNVASEWHPTKNSPLKPEQVLPASMKKVWWRCSKGHEWFTSINNRYAGNGCPYCSNRKIGKDNNLAVLFPEMSKEWHPTKNRTLCPTDISPGSKKKVWWRCSQGHEWITSPLSRKEGTRCPYCVQKIGKATYARLASEEYNLERKYPKIADEWHPKKNLELIPKQLTPSSGRKVWWICPEGHEYRSTPAQRTDGRGCPYCAGKLASRENNLETVAPQLAREWHREKNGTLTPRDVTPYSGKKVWWQCLKGHEWNAVIGNRITRGVGCPICGNKSVSQDNCLAITNPKLASEWHPTKNLPLSPSEVVAGSSKKAWWICKRGHVWKALIDSRNRGRDCPVCSSQTSDVEIRIYTELSYLFPEAKHRAKVDGIECDILVNGVVPFAVEVDGRFWHLEKLKKDRQKNEKLESHGIQVIRFRGKDLSKIGKFDINFDETKITPSDIKHFVENCMRAGLVVKNKKIEGYFRAGKFKNDTVYLSMLEQLPGPTKEKSLFYIRPDISKEWHSTKNGVLSAEDVSAGSRRNIWWVCEKGHEWKTSVYTRVKGSGCPYCSGKTRLGVKHEDSLGTLRPDLLQQWNQTKNSGLDPFTLPPKSNKKVWWVCEKGHEVYSPPYQRGLYGCVYCSKRKASKDFNFRATRPQIAKEWDLKKNLPLKPEHVTERSREKVWWICKNGHSWQAKVQDRVSKGSGCPHCWRERRKRLSPPSA